MMMMMMIKRRVKKKKTESDCGFAGLELVSPETSALRQSSVGLTFPVMALSRGLGAGPKGDNECVSGVN